MKKLIIKSFGTTFLFLLIVLMILYNFIYNPLYETLEETLLENFLNTTETSKLSFEYIIERGIENSKSISSRTMINNKILEYKEGKVDLQELKNYTQPRYNDGIEVLENVIYSARIVDNIIISSKGSLGKDIKGKKQVQDLVYEIFKENNRIYLLVYSPIKSNEVIGMDMIVFDLSNSLAKMELNGMSIDIVKEEETIKYENNLTVNPSVSEYKNPDDILYLNVFYKLLDDVFLHISTPKDGFYYKINNISRISLINLMIVFVFSFISINIIIILFAKEKINFLDKSNEKHKRDSHYDELTGAYSRLYLKQWLNDKKNKKLKYAMVFIDMNDFKDINDKYGHKKGDQVLKEIVSIFNNEIRKNDFIVRFGGDEFIILLQGVSKPTASKIIGRINEKIKSSIILDIKVSFSYGIGELENVDEFYQLLEEIDREMYEMKEEEN